jgi:hypothetical protein
MGRVNNTQSVVALALSQKRRLIPDQRQRGGRFIMLMINVCFQACFIFYAEMSQAVTCPP